MTVYHQLLKVTNFQVTGLSQLVANFPPSQAISFHDTHSRLFRAISKEESECKPDIASSHPCYLNMLAYPGMLEWLHASGFIEVKTEDSLNPWLMSFETLCESDRDMLTQIAKYARNLMFVHHSLFTFVIGIYGHSVRIYHFDHAGVIAL
jgi:hypothetical protein